MLKNKDGKVIYSPSDLIRFMESPFASWMDRLHLENPALATPDAESAEQRLVAEAGNTHEAAFLARLVAEGRDVCSVARDGAAEQATLAALAAGRAVVYQGCLAHSGFRGFTDFLVRTGPDAAGRAQYEVWDTKLAKKAKPYYLVQLCCYAEMLEAIQGMHPSMLRVVLGTGETASFRTVDFYDYYLLLKRSFLALMEQFSVTGTPPPPDPRADHARWASHAEKWLVGRDHLVQVAGITSGQIRKLEAAGIATMAALGTSALASVPKMAASVFERLREQAQLQVSTRQARASRPDEPPSVRVLKPQADEPRTGLALLPPASALDIYFDMEGFPLVENGLEYLWGATFVEGGQRNFSDWWAHDPAEEKAAFEGFIDWAHARWKADPAMHIYHYAAYEKSAVRRLAGRYATREEEVDDLLRHGVFVDLYQVVRQGLRVGEPSYSIKKIERLYRPGRSGAVATAGESIVQYALWMESGEPRSWRDSPILKGIRDYNRDDCDSTLELAEWLRGQQKQHAVAFAPPPAPVAADADPDAAAQIEAHAALLRKLAELAEHGATSEERKIAKLFLELLDFYRREARPMWWRYFERAEKTHEELKEDIDCIGDARLSREPPETVKRSVVYAYTFDSEQETKIGRESRVRPLGNLDASMEVVDIREEGMLRVKLGAKTLADKLGGRMPEHTSFIPDENVTTMTLRASLEEVISDWAATRSCPAALLRLLLRLPPAIPGTAAGVALAGPGESAVDAAVRIGNAMDRSTLCIQGPPGTGKTYTAAKMIEALLADGKRIGIMSNSHKAIFNLLSQVNQNLGGRLQGIKVGGEDDAFFASAPGMRHLEVSTGAADAYQGGVAAGTAWLFARPEWAGRLDFLFVDEAGQVALANVIAVCGAAANLVLMGDQMQLEQPVQGAHPGDSGQSALNYYLDGHATIPAELGIFLPVTRRMHPEICRFVSDLVYEGRLVSAPGNELRAIDPGAKPLVAKRAGLVFAAVEHDGNIQASDEEAELVVALANSLIGSVVRGTDGRAIGPLAWNDILFVCPYNLQVRKLRGVLPAEARVGSVDKFQGQEAAVVIVSMCSSFGEYGSRGLGFILDPNRINVAISRAQVLAVVVGDPRIATSPAGSIDEMRRINLYCRLAVQ